jgi:hypothetical protein
LHFQFLFIGVEFEWMTGRILIDPDDRKQWWDDNLNPAINFPSASSFPGVTNSDCAVWICDYGFMVSRRCKLQRGFGASIQKTDWSWFRWLVISFVRDLI